MKKVALYMDHGCRGIGAVRWAQLLSNAPEFSFAMLNAAEIKAGRLDGIDCLVMPGGGGLERYDDLGEDGCARIREFVRKGGGYIGTCAGESVLLNEPKRIRMLPFKGDGVWPRGDFSAQIELSPRFEELTGVKAGKRLVRYHNGPVAIPAEPIPGCKAEVVATFDCDGDPVQDANHAMRGAPAAIWAEYGKGRIFVFAVHPEAWDENLDLLHGAFRAVTGMEPAFRQKEIPPDVKVDRILFESSQMDRCEDVRGRLAAVLERAKGSDKFLVPYAGARLEGPFLLLLTPWTEEARVDIPALLKEAEYVDAAGAGGMIWPSAGERGEILAAGDYEAGLEALVARSAEKGRPFRARIVAIVSGEETAQGVAQASAVDRLAKKYGTELVLLARPADDCTDQASILAYYHALAKATDQTIIIQTFNGKSPQPSIETLIELVREHSNYGYVKEESPGLQVNGRMEQLLRRREIKGVFSGWGGKGWVYQGTRIGTCGVISQRAEYAPLFVEIWNRIQAGADASDPALARAFSAYLYMANLGDIFSTWQDDEMRGPHLYVLERLGIFRNRLTRENGKAVEWSMSEKEKAEVDARLAYIGILPPSSSVLHASSVSSHPQSDSTK
ncbi:MAG: dihydrodipicolinate synthase family protein [Kiritimatiellia bacterium]